MDKETFFNEYKGVAVAGVVVVVVVIVFLMNLIFSTKSLSLVEGGKIAIKAGDELTIKWSSGNIKRVGIALFDGNDAKWIVQNYSASAGKYVWNTWDYLPAGTEYRIAVFEYPWRNGGKVAYSSNTIDVVGQKYASCDDYSAEQEWPYLPDNYENAHKVFITSGSWSGNLGGLAGADAKCKQEAEKNNYKGNYLAFLGDDTISAAERITKAGIFIEAEPIGELVEGRTCHRFIAGTIQKFLDKTRLQKNLAEIELSESFARKLGDSWYGRRTASADVKCLEITMQGRPNAFSGTYTCQNWAIDKLQVYSGTIPEEADLPRCYNAEGKNVMANYYGAPAGTVDSDGTHIIGSDTCNNSHHLICIEQ